MKLLQLRGSLRLYAAAGNEWLASRGDVRCSRLRLYLSLFLSVFTEKKVGNEYLVTFTIQNVMSYKLNSDKLIKYLAFFSQANGLVIFVNNWRQT